ncbi:MAG TPA: ABC transporter permease [Vicinamibacterales bacterium]|jgi:putative ABC transport system permease protein
MGLTTAIHIALVALRRNLLRTMLTMLGMIIGVAAVIAIVALGRGAEDSIEANIKAAGTNMIIVSAGNWTQGGVRLGMGASSKLTPGDAAAIRTQVGGVQYVAPGVQTHKQVIVGGQNWSTSVQGTGPDLPNIRNWPLQYGDFFSAIDVNADARVAVLGSLVRDQLYGADVNPIGTTVRIGTEPFKVVGVLTSKGESSGSQDQDDVVFVPYTTAQKKLMGVTYLNNITLSAATAAQVPAITEDASEVLRRRHKIGPGDTDDFRVRNMEEIADVRSEATQTMTSFLASIGAVSLLVGGIGIMNIMLVSVTERTHEIGIRVAIGARGRDVRRQFLIEALMIGVAGGVLGILTGIGASRIFTDVFAWPTDVSTGAMLVAVGFAGAIGVFFGWYPATKAAALDPIEALRFDG